MPRPFLLKLTNTDRQELVSEAAQSLDEGVKKFCWAILLLAEGRTRQQVAEECGVHPITVGRWASTYRARGLAGFRKSKPSRRGRTPKLAADRLEWLKQTALTPPRQLGKAFIQWTYRRLARYLAQQTGVTLRPHYVALLLRRMGVIQLRPEDSAKSSQKSVQRKGEIKAPLSSGDSPGNNHSHVEAGFRAIPSLVVIWFFGAANKREGPSGSHGNQVLYGGLNLRSGQLTVHREVTLGVAGFIRFLEVLLEEYSKEQVLILAQSDSYRTTRKLETFLLNHARRLEIRSFPPGSAQPEALRRRWRETKSGETFSFLFNSPENLVANIRKGIGGLREVFML